MHQGSEAQRNAIMEKFEDLSKIGFPSHLYTDELIADVENQMNAPSRKILNRQTSVGMFAELIDSVA